MGFSVTITSSIILLAIFVLSVSFMITVFQGLKEILYVAEEYLRRGREKIDVSFQLDEVIPINATSCVITVKNVGSETIFFENQAGFKWNTIIVSYGNSSFWSSFQIEDYTILEVRVSGADYAFNPESHPYIATGEEAHIIFNIPEGAPEIPINGLISVVFVSHHGVVAKAEAVRKQ